MFSWLDSGNMIINLIVLIVGFVALIKGADIFVDGASGIARKFGVPGVIIGLTIVAMGTSAPELAVSMSAGIQGSNAMAVSNVLGSNLFNLLMVLGICTLISPLPVDHGIKRRDYPIFLICCVLGLFFASTRIIFGPRPNLGNQNDISGDFSRIAGIILIILFILFILNTIRIAKKSSTKDEASGEVSIIKSIIFIVLGLAMIVVGGDGVVESAKNLAVMWGMSETLVGLTIVSVGTSLPELVTSIVAAKKGENGMALGNAVGSCIFNVLLILGTTSAIHPIPVTVASFFDSAILLLVGIGCYFFVCSGERISRYEGAIMVAAYAGYMVYAVIR